jgi:hypothetical protein
MSFFKRTDIFESPGMVEVPSDLVLEELVKFTFPCILRIIDNDILLGGSVSMHHFLVA